jgi:hypothetical protein
MNPEERRRLVALELRAEPGTDLQEEIHDQLYEDPNPKVINVQLEINDPVLELSSLTNPAGLVVDEIMNELASEWFSRYQGASWWIAKFRGYRDGYVRGVWHETVEPFDMPPHAPPANPHEGHEIHVLVTDKTWHVEMPDGTLGDARELVSCDEGERYCETCSESLEP